MKRPFEGFLGGLFLYAMFGFGLYGIYVVAQKVQAEISHIYINENKTFQKECNSEKLNQYKLRIESLENMIKYLNYVDMRKRYSNLEINVPPE